MLKKIIIIIASTILTTFSFAQTIDSLKLKDTEIPIGYSKSKELLCKTPHSSGLYESIELYESMLGKVINKDFQSFEKKGDKGTILYFQFDNEFKADAFIEGLLWGEHNKPSKSEPDDYFSKGNILIVWSFALDSQLKKISKDKVMQLLHD